MSRFKRILKRSAIGLAILIAVLLILNGAYSWHMGRQLEQRLAKLRAAGEPTCLADLTPEPIPPEENAAFHLQRLYPELEAFANAEGAFSNTSVGKAIDKRLDKQEKLSPKQIAAVRSFLEIHLPLEQALERVAACSGYASQVDFSIPDSQQFFEVSQLPIQRVRWAARFLRWRMTLLLADGQQEEAVRLGNLMLRLGRLYDGEPLLVNRLVGIAVRRIAANGLNLALRAGPMPGNLHEELDQELAQHENPLALVQVLKTERALTISSLGEIPPGYGWHPLSWWVTKWQADLIVFYDQLLPLAGQSWPEFERSIGRLSLEAQSVAVASMLPALQATNEANQRSTALLRCLRILNALTAYAQANGHEAEGLDDLDLPDAAKRDPFSGQPMRLKWTDEGWVVYTVFKNGTDDDGDFKDQADWGLGPAGYPGAK